MLLRQLVLLEQRVEWVEVGAQRWQLTVVVMAGCTKSLVDGG